MATPQNTTASINAIITNLYGSGIEGDDLYVSLADKSNISILDAIRAVKSFNIANGLEKSNKEKRTILDEKIAELVEASVKGEIAKITSVNDTVTKLSEESGMSKASCKLSLVKELTEAGIAVELNVERKTGRVSQWMLDNPEATKKDVEQYLESIGLKASGATTYYPQLKFAREFMAVHGN